jgi:hypothetical protein
MTRRKCTELEHQLDKATRHINTLQEEVSTYMTNSGLLLLYFGIYDFVFYFIESLQLQLDQQNIEWRNLLAERDATIKRLQVCIFINLFAQFYAYFSVILFLFKRKLILDFVE